MAFRGRGRGRGYGRGGGFGIARQEPFVLFPDIENFPDANSVAEEVDLIARHRKLQYFWNSSPYYLKDEGPKKEESFDIERFSDRGKRKIGQKYRLSDFIHCSSEYVPGEVAQDSNAERHCRRKVRWNKESEEDPFDKLLKKYKGQQDDKDGKEKKEDEDEEEDDEEIEEQDEEYSDDGDYNQNIDFDDDDDDMNDDNDDEPIY